MGLEGKKSLFDFSKGTWYSAISVLIMVGTFFSLDFDKDVLTDAGPAFTLVIAGVTTFSSRIMQRVKGLNIGGYVGLFLAIISAILIFLFPGEEEGVKALIDNADKIVATIFSLLGTFGIKVANKRIEL